MKINKLYSLWVLFLILDPFFIKSKNYTPKKLEINTSNISVAILTTSISLFVIAGLIILRFKKKILHYFRILAPLMLLFSAGQSKSANLEQFKSTDKKISEISYFLRGLIRKNKSEIFETKLKKIINQLTPEKFYSTLTEEFSLLSLAMLYENSRVINCILRNLCILKRNDKDNFFDKEVIQCISTCTSSIHEVIIQKSKNREEEVKKNLYEIELLIKNLNNCFGNTWLPALALHKKLKYMLERSGESGCIEIAKFLLGNLKKLDQKDKLTFITGENFISVFSKAVSRGFLEVVSHLLDFVREANLSNIQIRKFFFNNEIIRAFRVSLVEASQPVNSKIHSKIVDLGLNFLHQSVLNQSEKIGFIQSKIFIPCLRDSIERNDTAIAKFCLCLLKDLNLNSKTKELCTKSKIFASMFSRASINGQTEVVKLLIGFIEKGHLGQNQKNFMNYKKLGHSKAIELSKYDEENFISFPNFIKILNKTLQNNHFEVAKILLTLIKGSNLTPQKKKNFVTDALFMPIFLKLLKNKQFEAIKLLTEFIKESDLSAEAVNQLVDNKNFVKISAISTAENQSDIIKFIFDLFKKSRPSQQKILNLLHDNNFLDSLFKISSCEISLLSTKLLLFLANHKNLTQVDKNNLLNNNLFTFVLANTPPGETYSEVAKFLIGIIKNQATNQKEIINILNNNNLMSILAQEAKSFNKNTFHEIKLLFLALIGNCDPSKLEKQNILDETNFKELSLALFSEMAIPNDKSYKYSEIENIDNPFFPDFFCNQFYDQIYLTEGLSENYQLPKMLNNGSINPSIFQRFTAKIPSFFRRIRRLGETK